MNLASLTSLIAAAGLAAGSVSARADHKESMAAPDAAAKSAHIMLTADEVRWVDGSPSLPPGGKMAVIEGDPKVAGALSTFRAKLPDGYKVPPHFHPADEHVTVISGTFHMGTGDVFDPAAAKALPAGSFIVMPKGEHHFAFVTGETVIQVHAIGPWGITYVNPADDPRNAKKK